MIESRGADGTIELITEQEYYMRIHRTRDFGVCGTCNGAGYLRYDRPVGSQFFGKLTPCPRCVSEKADRPDDARYGT